MHRTLIFISIAIFAVFLGSQITEGYLLVPYWKSLTATEFHDYYSQFGPIIGQFYKVLTIIAVLIPISASIYSFTKKSKALKLSITSTFFASLVILVFFTYFKETNQQFYSGALNDVQLKAVLETWTYWHWVRVLFEVLSLIFLILTFNIFLQEKNLKAINSRPS